MTGGLHQLAGPTSKKEKKEAQKMLLHNHQRPKKGKACQACRSRIKSGNQPCWNRCSYLTLRHSRRISQLNQRKRRSRPLIVFPALEDEDAQRVPCIKRLKQQWYDQQMSSTEEARKNVKTLAMLRAAEEERVAKRGGECLWSTYYLE